MVTFTSTPQGAEATITNKDGVPVHRGRTPFSVTLKASDSHFNGMDYAVRFKKKKCYQRVDTTLDSSLDE